MGKHILFFGESVTLAHVARPLALARACAGSRVTLACGAHYRSFAEAEGVAWAELPCVSPATFRRRLMMGWQVYPYPVMREYLRADLALIERHKPDWVVGDFRITLPLAAKLAGVPSISIASACWSAARPADHFPLPELAATHFLPLPVARMIFNHAMPLQLRAQAGPMNKLRSEHGLPPLPDMRAVYTEADTVLYADMQELFGFSGLPAHHRFIGPVLWSPVQALPAWWSELPEGKPVIYVSLGSSGSATLQRRVLAALAELPVTVIASGAGQGSEGRQGNAWLARYLPGNIATACADLLITNGGSLTGYEALRAGKPVLALPSNLDQCMNAELFVQAGLGLAHRPDRLRPDALRAQVMQLLEKPLPAIAPMREKLLQAKNAGDAFAEIVAG